MLPKEVTIVQVQDDIQFQQTTGQLLPVKTVQYIIANHGPFRISIPRTDFNPAVVEKLIMKDYTHLKDLGALPAET